MKIQVNSWVQMRQLWFRICHLMPMLYVSDIRMPKQDPMSAKKILITSSICLMALAATVPATAASRYTTRYRHHRGHIRRVAWNPVLRGSMDSMVRQNEEIDRLQLPRIADNDQLLELERTQELVPIAETRALRVNPSLQSAKEYCRPWFNQCLQNMSEA